MQQAPTTHMTTERRFTAIRIGVMRSAQFVQLTGLLMYGKHEIVDDIPTACTNGVDEKYGRDWIERWNDKVIAFTIVHEALHKAGRHLCIYYRLYEKDHKVANQACDYWNNAKVKEADPHNKVTEFPYDENGKCLILYDEKYVGWDIKRIFYDLYQKKQEQGKGQGQGQGEGQGGDGEGMESFDDHEWEAAQGEGEQAEKVKREIDHAIRQGHYAARQHGKGGGTDVLGLNGLLAPRIAWEQEMRVFWSSSVKKKTKSTWARPNRRHLPQNLILPSRKGNGINEVVYARDTSGSMNLRNRLSRVTTEVIALAKLVQIERIHFIDWDGEVERHEVYSSDKLEQADMTLKPTGGGGTDPTCVSDYLSKHNIKPDCIIIATDGEVGAWGTWQSPLLWVITNNNPIVAPVGKSIHVEDD